jgi:hypothetical protein
MQERRTKCKIDAGHTSSIHDPAAWRGPDVFYGGYMGQINRLNDEREVDKTDAQIDENSDGISSRLS